MSAEAVARNLHRHVSWLSDQIGERHMWKQGSLERAADYIASELESAGYHPIRQKFHAYGKPVCNLLAVKPGATHETIVIGAHYDTVPGSAGADDNASAVAGLLELARLMKSGSSRYTIHFAAFANEESPSFGSDYMGSMRYARFLRDNSEKVAFMVCLEMIGFFDKQRPQRYPLRAMRFFYPSRADFIAVVSNMASGRTAFSLASRMRARSDIAVACLVAPLPIGGIERSDHSAFWHYGFKAVMITDTAQYRNANYHRETDTIATLNFDAMSQVVTALHGAILSFK
jgi:Zn-dependent M28 family amino/carboxypeptidase